MRIILSLDGLRVDLSMFKTNIQNK